MSGPEGPDTRRLPPPRLHERDLYELKILLENDHERPRPEARTPGR
jgi:hypothetical protein